MPEQVCVLVTCLGSGAFTIYFYLYSKVQLLVLVRIISVIYSRQNLSDISKLQTKGKQDFPSSRLLLILISFFFFSWNMLPHGFICSYSLPSSSKTSLGPHCSQLKRSHMKTSHKTLNTSNAPQDLFSLPDLRIWAGCWRTGQHCSFFLVSVSLQPPPQALLPFPAVWWLLLD